MKNILFSQQYTKMPDDPSPSTLLEVFVVDRVDLCNEFVEYDTRITDGGNYKLVHGKLLVLLLKTRGNDLWTTIRRCTSCKLRYYRKIRGSVVNIVVEEKNRSLNEYM